MATVPPQCIKLKAKSNMLCQRTYVDIAKTFKQKLIEKRVCSEKDKILFFMAFMY